MAHVVEARLPSRRQLAVHLSPRANRHTHRGEDRQTASVERREVELGERREGWVEVIDGIEPGERLVRHGIQKVRDGDSVRVLDVAAEDNPIREILRRHRAALAAERSEP